MWLLDYVETSDGSEGLPGFEQDDLRRMQRHLVDGGDAVDENSDAVVMGDCICSSEVSWVSVKLREPKTDE